jgi:hypothetical protein
LTPKTPRIAKFPFFLSSTFSRKMDKESKHAFSPARPARSSRSSRP